ncbi:uncharacterized protein LOC107841485 [Capsicum annuum]|uniref:uncharacterized protein LOC107841485 n=1 Tax=Capsicum annuum TaxID=4072 RepID=UPI0007BF31B6|nr:uncharacterized protein LOC107841485 [Capsicum annuum]
MEMKKSLKMERKERPGGLRMIRKRRFGLKKVNLNYLIMCGSCANEASVSMVNHLKFPSTPHMSPYRLQWLNDCGELKVTHQVVIRFKVRNYEDEVLCDIIPMHAYNVLLGRPLQYDRSTKHDGRTSYYSFEFKGQKYNLRPLLPSQVCEAHQQMKNFPRKGKKKKEPMGKEEELKSRKGEGEEGVSSLRGRYSMVMLARKGDLFKEYDDTNPMLLLAFVLNAKPSIFPILSSISNVLKEFDDVFESDLPQGLPPLRGIKHQIKFILGS